MGITTLDTEQNAGKTCTYYIHATLKRSAVKVVVMRILLQPFTSFGCHGYTAGGPSSWTPRREQGEGGMLEAWPIVCDCLASLSMHQLTGPGI